MNRKLTLTLALASSVGLGLVATAARAQDFPSRRITIVVPFPAGGTTDTMMRIYGERLSQRVNQPVIVEPKPGAASILGASAVLQAPADGYTMLFTGPQGYVPEFNRSMPFDFLRDFQAIGTVIQFPLGVLVNRQYGARSLKEIVDYAKANPGKLNTSSSTPVLFVAQSLFLKDAGINVVTVNYKGAVDSERALAANEVQFMLGNLSPGVRENAPEAKVRAIAVAAPTRHPDWPDVPTTAEQGYPNLLLGAMLTLHVSAKTPPAVVQRLGQETNAILAQPDVQQRLRQMVGGVVEPTSPVLAQQQIAEMYKRWADAVRAVGFKPE